MHAQILSRILHELSRTFLLISFRKLFRELFRKFVHDFCKDFRIVSFVYFLLTFLHILHRLFIWEFLGVFLNRLIKNSFKHFSRDFFVHALFFVISLHITSWIFLKHSLFNLPEKNPGMYPEIPIKTFPQVSKKIPPKILW